MTPIEKNGVFDVKQDSCKMLDSVSRPQKTSGPMKKENGTRGQGSNFDKVFL